MDNNNFNRRDVLKGTAVSGIAAAGIAGLSGTSAAATDNSSRNCLELNVRLFTDGTVGNVDTSFEYGARNGVEDFAEWLETWMPYVTNVDVYEYLDATDEIDPLPSHDSGDPEQHIRREILLGLQKPGCVNIVLCEGGSGLHLGHSWGNLYGYKGTVCYLNSTHSYLSGLTGYDYGYNTAIHEMMHGMTFENAHNAHKLGVPDINGNDGNCSVMATGYSSDYSDDVPSFGCHGTWPTVLYPDPKPKMSNCAVSSVRNYHYGIEDDRPPTDYKNYTDISSNEFPIK